MIYELSLFEMVNIIQITYNSKKQKGKKKKKTIPRVSFSIHCVPLSVALNPNDFIFHATFSNITSAFTFLK